MSGRLYLVIKGGITDAYRAASKFHVVIDNVARLNDNETTATCDINHRNEVLLWFNDGYPSQDNRLDRRYPKGTLLFFTDKRKSFDVETELNDEAVRVQNRTE